MRRVIADIVDEINAKIVDRNKVPTSFGFGFEILGVEEQDGVLKVKYKANIPYGKKGELANFEFKGTLYIQDEPQNIKEVLEKWEKEKKLPEEWLLFIVRALQFGATQYSTILSHIMKYKPPYILPKIELVPAKKSAE